LQSIDREAALAQPFKAYFELDRERPFFEALGDFRSHIAKCEEHVATAMSEVSPFLSIWQGSCSHLMLTSHSKIHNILLLEVNPASIL